MNYPTPNTKPARTLLVGGGVIMAVLVIFAPVVLFAFIESIVSDWGKLLKAFVKANPHLSLVNLVFIWSWGTWLIFSLISRVQEYKRACFLRPPEKLYRIQVRDAMERIVAYLRERSYFFGDSWKQKLVDQESPRLLYQLEFRAPVSDEYFSPRKNMYRNLFILDIYLRPASIDDYSEIQFRFEAITEYDFQTIDPIIATTRHDLERELGYGFHCHSRDRFSDEFGPVLTHDTSKYDRVLLDIGYRPSSPSDPYILCAIENLERFDIKAPIKSWESIIDRAPPIWLLCLSGLLILSLIPLWAGHINTFLSTILGVASSLWNH